RFVAKLDHKSDQMRRQHSGNAGAPMPVASKDTNMAHFLAARDRAPTKSPTVKFEGGAYGTGISFFAVDTGPGQGVGLHVHPYAETWFVQEGNVAFQAGTDQVDAGPGDIMVVEAG